MRLLDVTAAQGLVREAMALIDGNALAPRDAFHLAMALREGLSGLVSADRDFTEVQLPEGRNLVVVRF